MGIDDQPRGASDSPPEGEEVDHQLTAVSDRTSRQNLLQLTRRHQAAGEGEKSENNLRGNGEHAEGGQVRSALVEPEVILRRADQSGGQSPESMRQRRPLRHRSERDLGERDPDESADHHRQGYPRQARYGHGRIKQCAADPQHHRPHAGPDPAPRTLR